MWGNEQWIPNAIVNITNKTLIIKACIQYKFEINNYKLGECHHVNECVYEKVGDY
jgi:hypothetical protein